MPVVSLLRPVPSERAYSTEVAPGEHGSVVGIDVAQITTPRETNGVLTICPPPPEVMSMYQPLTLGPVGASVLGVIPTSSVLASGEANVAGVPALPSLIA